MFHEKLHIPVLWEELSECVKLKRDDRNIIIDATLWMWWHATKIIQKMNKWDIFVWFDTDQRNLDIVKPSLEVFAQKYGVQIYFVHDNFVNLKSNLENLWIPHITWIYYDLWLSSLHVDEAERGFSFQKNGPLDMRFDTRNSLTASKVVQRYTVAELTRIFKEYGEETQAKRIAQAIGEERKKWVVFKTTFDLVDLITKITWFPKTKIKVFQALRIEVNNELEVIKESIQSAIDLLEKDGTIFVISFHSLEDRIIKNIFKKESADCVCDDIFCTCFHKKQLILMNKKPIIPSDMEVKTNPRSRSAKARYAIKI